MGDDSWEEIEKEAKERGKHALGLLWDALFLAVWLALQWGVAKLRDALPLSESDASWFNLFQWTLGWSTFILIVIWVVRDLAVIAIRAMQRIRDEFRR